MQKRLDSFPSEYFLLLLPQENRVHVATQLTRYHDEDSGSEWHGHLLAYVGEVDIGSGVPQLMALRNTDKEKQLFCYMSYNKQQLLGQDEIEEFLGDEENFGKFHAAPGLKASRPSKKRRGESFSETPLLLRIPAQYALVFLDSPLLGLAWLRAHAMIYMELEDGIGR